MIDILMSTYNGEKYLGEQIDSLILQTYRDWHLLIRDDGSSDRTLELIDYYQKKYPEKIEIIKDSYGNIKSTNSFAVLLEYSTAPYIMFCDQDDIWLSNKIELAYLKIKNLEDSYESLPLLVFSDLILYGHDGRIISDSFMKYQNMKPDVVYNTWMCMAMSVAPGCTMMINHIAKKYVLPIPSFMLHDYWIATMISYYGKCEFINTPTIYYRIHNHNSVGINNVGKSYLISKIRNLYCLFPQYRKIFKAFPFKVSYSKVIYFKVKFNVLRFLGVKLFK